MWKIKSKRRNEIESKKTGNVKAQTVEFFGDRRKKMRQTSRKEELQQ